MAFSRIRAVLLPSLMLLPAVVTGCGAGVGVTAWFTKERGARPPELAPPQLSISSNTAPLKVVDDLVFRNLTVSNYRVKVENQLRLELHALGIVQEQHTLALTAVQGNTSTFLFAVETSDIYGRVRNDLRDVVAELHLFVGGQEIAPAIPFTLFREPEIEFHEPATGPVFVSVDGTTSIQLRVQFLRADQQDDASVEFLLRQPEHPPGPPQGFRVQRATAATFDFEHGLVTALCPPHPHAGLAGVLVRDSRSGTSAVLPVRYIPSVQFPVPTTGTIDGGETVTLSGVGLVPEENVNGRAEPQWNRITLWVRKGSVVSQVDPGQILIEFSRPSVLQFRMPPSPDGEPGAASIILRTVFADETTYDTLVGGGPNDRRTFRYGRSSVLFLRKFTLLPEGGRAFATGNFDDAGAAVPTTDVAVVTGSSETAPSRINLLTGTGRGLFFRRGMRVEASDPLQTGQARCGFLLSGRIRRGVGPDLLAIHRGTGAIARHAPLLLRLPASQPFQLYTPGDNLLGWPDACGAACGDLDEDGLTDFFVLGRPTGQETYPEWFRPLDPGAPGINPPFTHQPIDLLPQSAGRVVVARDLDGDGHLDLAYANSSTPVTLSVLFGDGRGGFLAWQSLPCEVPGFAVTGDLGARVIVPLRGGQGATGPWCQLAVVMAGDPASPTGPPAVVTVTFDPVAGRYRTPTSAELVTFATETAALHAAAGGDLDGDGLDDLFLAAEAGAQEPLRALLQDASGHLVPAPAGSVPAPEGLANGIAQLQFIDLGSGTPPRPALLGLHDFTVGQFSQRVLSAWSVRDHKLQSTDGSGTVPQIPIKAVAGGLFTGSVDGLPDLAVSDATGFSLLANDGSGSFAAATPQHFDVPGILPRTLAATRRSGAPGACVSFVTQDGRIGCFVPGASAPTFAPVDLRTLCGPPFSGVNLADDCEQAVADVDGDGRDDVVLLLRPVRQGTSLLGEGDARILFLKGLGAGEPFPFRLPADASFVASVHGEARAVHLCNLLGAGVGAALGDPLELVVAVKGDPQTPNSVTNHVRFFRFLENDGQRDDDGMFQRSAASGQPDYLLAGDQPTALQSLDVDGDGRTDLVVLSESDRPGQSLVRLFFNRMSAAAPEVDVSRLLETAQSPEPTLGAPRGLAAADINGDAQSEIMVFTHLPVPQGVLMSLRLLGAGFPPGGPAFVSADLTGPGAFNNFLLQDLDADGIPDLVILRDLPGAGSVPNVRVLAGTPQ